MPAHQRAGQTDCLRNKGLRENLTINEPCEANEMWQDKNPHALLTPIPSSEHKLVANAMPNLSRRLNSTIFRVTEHSASNNERGGSILPRRIINNAFPGAKSNPNDTNSQEKQWCNNEKVRLSNRNRPIVLQEVEGQPYSLEFASQSHYRSNWLIPSNCKKI